ncbi:4-alpha-glucanotransferase family protein [Histomonas meleagridis]|uniref:4-alpha-glucanotransferase family protein n=1 Tax=Histomonas meleagridis TaxID=135588 RepID=UPI003559B80E|nr:4-alpha-glucanotransferase family protein [Histomonas meleagridis]KAH0799161.1 4-alpha-glucanotransferase family protein [Histomonas meleagridis]
MISITFNLKSTRGGDTVAYITGNCKELGNNDPNKALPLEANEGPYQGRITVSFDKKTLEGPVYYSYFLKPSFGGLIQESVTKRIIPTVLEQGCIYDTFDAATSVNDVLIHFRVRCHTYYGQQLYVCGDIKELGEWNIDGALLLTFDGNADYWSGTIRLPLSKDPRTVNYKYIIASSHDNLQWEPKENHKLELGPTVEPCLIEIADQFRWHDSTLDAFTRSTFVDVIDRRDHPTKVPIIEPEYNEPGKAIIYFSAYCPYVRHYQTVKVVGSIPELGNWDEHKAIPLTDGRFPQWMGKVKVDLHHLPFEYKYIICGPSNEKAIWEMESNRTYDGICTTVVDSDYPRSVFINEWFVCPNRDLFKGLGIYSPVFSLRTDHSCGIGQYLDIKKLVDLCVKVGASMIQLLPINDTTDKGEWADSYPYRQVSCFALHPIYIDLLAITKLPPEYEEEINKKKYELEQQPWIDYPEVFKFKMEMLKKIYKLVDLEKDSKYQEFIVKNKSWLQPYSLYCYYRDLNGTSDYRQWKEHSTITMAEIEKICSTLTKELEFTNWLQYLCDVQFKEAREYAVQHRVALKGDLPIGVFLNSVECWAYPKNFRMDMCAGAPPDSFSGDGQNWSFPTYDWDYMASDNYSWWRMRLQRMAELFHTLRVDHVLGFFRIWEIPRATCVRGMLGHYFPCNPVHINELKARGLYNIDRYIKPYVRWHLLCEKFGGEAYEVSQKYFNSRGVDVGDDYFDFKPEYDNEVKIKKAVEEIEDENKRNHYYHCLIQLVGNVCLIQDQNDHNYYHVRTEVKMEHIEETPNGPITYVSSSWNELPENEKRAMEELSIDFTYKRNNALWVSKANPKLDILKDSTNMLICGEDLGQLTQEILDALQSKSLLSLRVQRMSKDPNHDFDEIESYQYMSVCCPSTHDSSTLRGWWEENRPLTEKYWHDQLWRHDNCPYFCEPFVVEMIIKKHLWSRSMWAIFLLQDLADMVDHLRKQSPQDERINYPPDPNHKWKYRYPYTMDELINDSEFTNKLFNLAKDSHRI